MKNRHKKAKKILPLVLLSAVLVLACSRYPALDEAVSSAEKGVVNYVYFPWNMIYKVWKILDNIDDQGASHGNITTESSSSTAGSALNVSDVPEYNGNAYAVINDNIPDFDQSDLSSDSFEIYSSLDSLGRCGSAYANIGIDLMPTEERGNIGQVKPSGWHTVKYDCVDGKYLYNRCHLIGYQLTAENANEKNLITGTRYLNVQGMLPFENMVADYIKETENHVLYRVTPVFEGNNLVASGVQIEAESVEDDGEGIQFNVYCYNVQPGIIIDYATGESSEASAAAGDSSTGR